MTDQRQPTIEPEPFRGQPVLGSIALFSGAALIFLMIAESVSGLPFNMPRSWYANPALWWVFALAVFISGWFLLRNRTERPDSWRPTESGIRFESVMFYTRSDCHLCDHAKDTLLKYARFLPEVEEQDIDADEQLVQQFGDCVPVVEFDGKVHFRGDVDEVLLRRLIEGTRPREG